MVELVGGGSLSRGPTPSSFSIFHQKSHICMAKPLGTFIAGEAAQSKVCILGIYVRFVSFKFVPRQTLVFSNVSKEQLLYKLVIGLNPVFQPILTVTIVTVNMDWNTGFCLVTDLNKGCS